MLSQTEHRTRRIARNTLMLYIRMFVLMLVGLYTSRVVLAALGENDFGVYNVVGGVVAMFAIISGALNSAVQRFITFALGKEDKEVLGKVYSTAVMVQALISLLIVAVAEPVGLWFIDNEMTIEPSRIPAARLVLHFSLLSFVINLMSVPQMASITAHERMSAYAWIGVLDGLLRLVVALLIAHSSSDRLVMYAMLMTGVVLLVRLSYGIYCRLNFDECRFKPIFDKNLIKEMFSFAGWNFIGVTSGVLRDHGGNILVNLFAGPAVNAARGVAMQLNGAVQGFVTNFMTAVNPQITKSYASSDHAYMYNLIRKSARMSYYLLFILALPVLFNTEYIMGLWLKDVPEHSVLFVRLFLIFALTESLSNPLITAQLATGRIRDYQLVVGGLQLLNLPVSYLFLKAGAVPEVTVMVAIALSLICLSARLVMLKRMIGLDVMSFLRRVCVNVAVVTALAILPPLFLCQYIPDTVWGFAVSVTVCVFSSALSIFVFGLSAKERADVAMILRKKLAYDKD